MDNTSVIRTAAILYADDNQSSTQKTIHRKIVESIFVNLNNEEITIHQILDKIKNKLDLVFQEDEVINIINDTKKGHFEVRLDFKSKENFIKLSNQRYENLKQKENKNNIENYISQYIDSIYNGGLSKEEVENALYKYIYELLNKNISAFSKIISPKFRSEEIIINPNLFDFDKREAINGFLNWENPQKNKSLFNIVSYAIEYSLISNNIDSSNVFLNSIRNKIFYIDNNVIYRIIGINGEDRKNKIKIFIKKCKDCGQKLVISKYTYFEFKETISYHTRQLKNVPFNKINPAIFSKYAVNSSVYEFYHTWRKERSSYSFDHFNAYLLGLYKDFIDEFGVTEEFKVPFKEDDEKSSEAIKKYANEIATFKGNGNIDNHYYDAKNTYLIEKKRGENCKSINDTKYFFVSVDQRLRNWDFQRNDNQPIALLPSQWMSIILKYFARTDDDFKSFVSFLKLNIEEPLIQADKLQIILSGISEITEDFDKQSVIFERMLEVKFDRIIDGNGINEIRDQSVKFAKKIMDGEMIKLKKEHEMSIQEYQDQIMIKENENLEDTIHTKSRLSFEIGQSINAMESTMKILDKVIKKRYNNLKIKIVAILLLFYCSLLFSVYKVGWEIMEPIVWSLGATSLFLTYTYFAIKGESFNPSHYFKAMYDKESEFVYTTNNFDINRLTKLKAEKELLDEEIQSLVMKSLKKIETY